MVKHEIKKAREEFKKLNRKWELQSYLGNTFFKSFNDPGQ